jgi:hypothetical protein
LNDSTIASGQRLTFVYVFCSPLAYELCLIVPDNVPELKANPDWFGALCRAASFKRRKDCPEFLVMPLGAFKDDQTLLEASLLDLVQRWTRFYNAALLATCANALNGEGDHDGWKEHLCVIRIHRRLDLLSRKSIGFSFRFIEAAKIHKDELSQWVLLHQDIPSLNHQENLAFRDLLKDMKRPSSVSSSNMLLDVVFIASSSDTSEGISFYRPLGGSKRERGIPASAPLSWLAFKKPFEYLKDTIEKGLYVSEFHMNAASCYEYDAWGFESPRRDLSQCGSHFITSISRFF